MAHCEHAARSAGRRDHPVGLGERGRDGLLDQDMDAPAEQARRQLGVRHRRHRDDRRVESGDELLFAREELRAVLGRHRLGDLAPRIEEPDAVHAVDLSEQADVVTAESAGAEDADPQVTLRRHRSPRRAAPAAPG